MTRPALKTGRQLKTENPTAPIRMLAGFFVSVTGINKDKISISVYEEKHRRFLNGPCLGKREKPVGLSPNFSGEIRPRSFRITDIRQSRLEKYFINCERSYKDGSGIFL